MNLPNCLNTIFHILIIKTSSLGDVVHTLPALTEAAANIKNIQFDWVVEESFAEIPSWHKKVDKVIPVALRRWRKRPIRTLLSKEWRVFLKQLRVKQYDLIIADLKEAELIFIKDGVLEKQDAGFIGDPTAYNIYQKKYHEFENNPEHGKVTLTALLLPEQSSTYIQDVYKHMYCSLREVCLNNTVRSVGGIIVPLCSNNNKFTYMYYMDSVLNSLDFQSAQSQPQLITYGSSSDGSCTVEFFGNAKNPGYYFLQGGFGIVYLKNNFNLFEPKIISAVNPAHWAIETTLLLGEGFKSAFLNVDNCGELGDIFLKKEEYHKAIYCYELKVDDPQLLGDRKKICDRYIAGYATALFNIGEAKKADLLLKKWVGLIDKHKYIDEIIKQINLANN